MHTQHTSIKTAPTARYVRHERVSIGCPHCWGTGDMELFDNVKSKHKRDCVFCEGSGRLVMEVSV